MLEDSAYRRLLDAYYIKERPLPLDVKECCKLARAQSVAERDAVAAVLKEFFEQREDGYHQKRADEEIARYQEAEPEREAKREAKRENDKERQHRSRQRRAQMFEFLRANGIVPRYNATTATLEALKSQVLLRRPVAPVTRDETVTIADVTRDNTATHSQSPVPSHKNLLQDPPPDTRVSVLQGADSRVNLQPHEWWDLILKAYPTYSGSANLIVAQRNAGHLVDQYGAAWVDLYQGTLRYAAFVAGGGVSDTGKVKHPTSFFDTAASHWRNPWALPAPIKPPVTRVRARTTEELEAAEAAANANH